VLDRKLGEYVLPDGWVYLQQAIRPPSGACISRCRGRCATGLFISTSKPISTTVQWAVSAGVRPEIIAFLRFKPDLLHTADATSDANAWPTPRSWKWPPMFCAALQTGKRPPSFQVASEFEAQLLDGTVGPAAAAGADRIPSLFRQLPSIDEILLNPETAPLPAETSAQIAIATALGRAMTDNSVARGLKYLTVCRPKCASWLCATRRRGTPPSPTRRSLSASVCNRRPFDDY